MPADLIGSFDLVATEASPRRRAAHRARAAGRPRSCRSARRPRSRDSPRRGPRRRAQIILGNTYHLALRPGDELVARTRRAAPLHALGPARSSPTPAGSRCSACATPSINDDGARVPVASTTARRNVTPERAVEIQQNLGSDIAMVLDECPPRGRPEPAEIAGRGARARRPARRRAAQERTRTPPVQAQFAIVQGGLRPDAARAERARVPTWTSPATPSAGLRRRGAAELMHAGLPRATPCCRRQAPLPHGRRRAGRPARRGRRRASTCSTA